MSEEKPTSTNKNKNKECLAEREKEEAAGELKNMLKKEQQSVT